MTSEIISIKSLEEIRELPQSVVQHYLNILQKYHLKSLSAKANDEERDFLIAIYNEEYIHKGKGYEITIIPLRTIEEIRTNAPDLPVAKYAISNIKTNEIIHAP